MRPLPLVRELRKSLTALGIAGRRILVAVSGGPDSVALLLGLAELREGLSLELEVATIDHQLRPGSAADASYVKCLAKRLGLACQVERVEVKGEGGLEAAARRARYAALRRIAGERGCAFIATGHTLEDQAETVLLRLARGAGVRGLRGILPRRGQIVRPMLEVSRSQVADFLSARAVVPRIDPTNRSDRFARNRVRALVLPALEKALGPKAIVALARSAEIAAQDDRALERLARRRAKRILRQDQEGRLTGELEPLLALEPALQRRVLRRACKLVGLDPTRERLLAMAEALASKGPRSVQVGGGKEFQVRYGSFTLGGRRTAGEPQCFERLVPGVGQFRFAEGTVEVRRVVGRGVAAQGAIRIDPAQVALPLMLRSRRRGDRFRARGGRLKKLKAFLIDRKVPREEREQLPLLADSQGRVLWVVGVAPSDAAEQGERAQAAWEVAVDRSTSARRDGRLSRSGSEAEVAVAAGRRQKRKSRGRTRTWTPK